MFGKVASISFVLALSAFAGLSRGEVLSVPPAGEFSQLSPAKPVDLALPPTAAQRQVVDGPARTNDTPTAPLPPALWPGLLLLVSLGGVKVITVARRRIARG